MQTNRELKKSQEGKLQAKEKRPPMTLEEEIINDKCLSSKYVILCENCIC